MALVASVALVALVAHRVLFVLNRYEPDTSRFEDVQSVHEGRADDAEDVLGVVSHQGLDESLAGGHQGRFGSPGG